MPLICAGTPLLRKSSQRSDREVCDAYVAAANAAYDALVEVGTAVPPRLAQLPVQVVKGEDVSLLIVLQREMGAVAPSEVNPLSGSAIQSRICSIDATTCLIAAVRDPYSGTTVVAHFDHGGDQTEDGLVSMLNYLPAKPITTAGLLTTARRDEVEAATSANKAKRYVELYLLGAVKFDKYSAETLGSFLRNCADDQDTVFDVVLHGTCVWTQNVKPGKSGMLIHRGLMVDAKTGACSPVECDKQRAYPAGRLRALRSMDSSDRHVSGITLMPGETVSTPQPVDAPGKRRALQYVLIVRPFKFPEVGSLAARKPLSFFASMSTTPDMEPEDFAETLKSSVVYASLTTGDKVFTPHPSNPRKPSPVAFQLCVGAINASEGNAIAQDVTDDAATKSTAADADAAPETAGEAAPAEDVAPAPAPRMAFYWYQISPARAVENL